MYIYLNVNYCVIFRKKLDVTYQTNWRSHNYSRRSPEQILAGSKSRLEALSTLWNEHRDRLIYNELEGSVKFSDVRPTDYRHNKTVKLPEPFNLDDEFYCEVRRKKILVRQEIQIIFSSY